MKLIILPDEIILKILKDNTLSIEDIFAISEVCRRLNDISNTEDLWKEKYQRRWPWIWKRIVHHESRVTNWKREVLTVKLLAHKFSKRLETLSADLFKCKNITTPVLNSITEFFKIGTFGCIYILNELRDIICDKGHDIAPSKEKHRQNNSHAGCMPLHLSFRQRPNWVRVLPRQNITGEQLLQSSKVKNLTQQYYAQLVLHHVHQITCQEEWKEYFQLPPSKQTLEKGAFLFAKWFQPSEFLDMELQDITLKLDDLAIQIQSHLKTKYPDHRALSHSLISPDEPLEDTLWSKTECDELFDSINHVLFTVNKYKRSEYYYIMDNSFINKVMQLKEGIPVTLSIIYKSVCHRLGLALYPVNCPSHFMLKWRVPMTDRIEYIDSYNRGERTSANYMSFDGHPNLGRLGSMSCPTSKVLERMANNTIHVGQQNLQNFDRFTDICSAAEISMIFKPNNEDTLEFIYSLYLSFELHIDRIISGCNELLRAKPHLKQRFGALKEKAEKLLEIQKKRPQPVVPKRRSSDIKVQFTTGMIMIHKLYRYTCVIFGWDTTCKMPWDWIVQMNVLSLKYQHEQPFYNVLVSDGSQRYAAQENLLETEPVVVTHKEVGKYFQEFNGQYYIPNAELKSEYPDDDGIRKSFYPNL